MGLSPEWVEVLACPDCRGHLTEDMTNLVCMDCGNSFEITDGVALLVSQSGGFEEDHIKQQKKYFNNEFKAYGEYKLENWRKSYLDRIFRSLGFGNFRSTDKSDHFYLDVGCGGSGYTVIEAARKNIRSIGCDLSLEGMLKAQRFARGQGVSQRALFVVCSAEQLPFQRDIFSGISSVAVLEHLSDDNQAIKEMFRVAKANALVYVMVPNAYRKIWPFLWIPYYIHDKRIGHLRHYLEDDLICKFEKPGFKLLEIYYSGHMIKVWQLLLSLLPLKEDQMNSLWWRLENRDLRKKEVSTGVNVNATFSNAE